MAAPTFVAASTGTTDATGGWTHTGPAPGATGRLYIVHVLQDGTNAGVPAISSVTNAQSLSGVNNTLTKIGQFDVGSPATARHHVWMGRSTTTSAMVITGANTGGDDVYVRVYVFDGVSSSTSLTRIIENGTRGVTVTSTGTSATASDAAVTTLGPDRLVVNLLAINDDNPVGAFSGQTGGTWAETVAEYATQSGTDGCIQIQTATLTAAGTIGGGTASITDPDGWGVVGFALLPTGPAVYSASVVDPITFNNVTFGRRRLSSQVSTAVSANVTTVGILPTRGVVSWASFTNPLPVSIKTSASFSETYVSVTKGRSTLGRSAAAFGITLDVTSVPKLGLYEFGGGAYGSGNFGDEIKTAASSLAVTADVVTSGAPLNPQTVSGAASLEITNDATVNGIRKTFGAVVVPETIDRVTAGRVGFGEQVTFVATYGVSSAAKLTLPGRTDLPITANIVTRSTTAGSVGGSAVYPVTWTSSTTGIVTARSSVDFDPDLLQAVTAVHIRRGLISATVTATTQTTGRLTARGQVALPITFGVATGRVMQFGAVDANFVFNVRTMRPDYNPPRNGYIAFPRRGRLRKGSQVELV